jgi:hypothetical protein
MDSLERQIADAINVDPSPEFVARMRARVAAEGVPRRRTSPFFVAAAAIAATTALALWPTRADRTVQPTLPAPRQVAVARPAPVKPPTMTLTARVKPTPPQAAQIVIAEDEIRGLHALTALVRDGVELRFDEQKADEPRVPSVKEIDVAPIHITPLTVASNLGQEGDEQ